MDVQEFTAVESIEITGSYRIASVECWRCEEVVMETAGSINTPNDLTEAEINDLVDHGIVPRRSRESSNGN